MSEGIEHAAHTLKILIADDDEGDRKQVRRALKQAGLSCECVEVVEHRGRRSRPATSAHFDCAFVDYRMPGHDGLHGITALHERLPDMSIIMATGQGDEMVATEAMKRGASDYIPKAQIDAKSIRRIVENALEKATLRREMAQQREELENFAAVLVHDLSAPIASLQMFAPNHRGGSRRGSRSTSRRSSTAASTSSAWASARAR